MRLIRFKRNVMADGLQFIEPDGAVLMYSNHSYECRSYLQPQYDFKCLIVPVDSVGKVQRTSRLDRLYPQTYRQLAAPESTDLCAEFPGYANFNVPTPRDDINSDHTLVTTLGSTFSWSEQYSDGTRRMSWDSPLSRVHYYDVRAVTALTGKTGKKLLVVGSRPWAPCGFFSCVLRRPDGRYAVSTNMLGMITPCSNVDIPKYWWSPQRLMRTSVTTSPTVRLCSDGIARLLHAGFSYELSRERIFLRSFGRPDKPSNASRDLAVFTTSRGSPDTTSADVLRQIGHVSAFDVSPDGRTLALACSTVIPYSAAKCVEKQKRFVCLFDLREDSVQFREAYNFPATTLSYSADGTRLGMLLGESPLRVAPVVGLMVIDTE